jgi:hypothetical protein
VRTVRLVDDLDGGEADETVEFAIDGKTYQIDLSTAHAEQFREIIDDYVKAARRTGGHAKRGTGAVKRSDKAENAKIRAWAQEHGMKIAERGRIPEDIARAYHEAA